MIKIDALTETKGLLISDTPSRLLELSRGMPGRYKWVSGQLYFEITRNNLEYLHVNLPAATWTPTAKKKLETYRRISEQELEVSKRKTQDFTEVLKNFPFKLPPFSHQAKAFALSRDEEYFALFMEMGTGKTKVIIDTAAYLWLSGKIDGVLILSPNGVHRQWVKEQIPDHMSSKVAWVANYYESGNNRLKDRITRNLQKTELLRILSGNIEAVSHKSGVEFFADWMKKIGRVLFVIDESSRIGQQGSKRTQNVLKVLKPLATYRRIMSGTPISKGVEDLYTQLKFLSDDILGFSSFYTFRNFYCRMGGWENKKIVGYQNLDTLVKKLETCSYRVVKEECLDLPERTFTTREVDLTPEQNRIYHELRKEFLSEISTGNFTAAPLAITRLIRLRQVLNGHVISEEGNLLEIPSNKVQVALEVVKEASGKIIIWCPFRHDVTLLGKALKEENIGFVRYTGKETQAEREEALELLRNDESTRVMLSNPQAGGIGLNLVAASVCVWYSPIFSLQDYLQANDRIHRIGQSKNTLYVHLHCENTIETRIFSQLMKKKSVADTVLDIERLFEEDAQLGQE